MNHFADWMMSDVGSQIVLKLLAIIIIVLQAFTYRRASKNAGKLESMHAEFNGMKDQLVQSTAVAAHAQGVSDEKAEQVVRDEAK